jgi:hypothetical protein
MTGIYQLEINKKLYIGSSIHVERRIIQHKSDLKRNRHDNPILQNAYNKYKTLTVTILKKLDDSISDLELRQIEKEFIDQLHPHFNIQDPETHFQAKKLYQFDLNGNFIKEYNNVSEASIMTGCSSSNIIHAAQINERLTRTAGGYYWQYTSDFISREKDKRLTAIHVYTLSGKYIQSFETMKECCKTLFPHKARSNVDSVINRICKYKTASLEGYRFSYEKVEHLDNTKLLTITKNFPVLQLSSDKTKILSIAENATKMAKSLGIFQSNISYSIIHNTPYKGFYFLRLGTESRELLETLEGTETTAELETVNVNV